METHQPSRKEVKKATKEIAALLGETEAIPKDQIYRLISVCGTEFARTLYTDALAVEANGGLMLPDNSRRRTLGGVFFFLARERLTESQRQEVFPGPFWKKYKSAQKHESLPLLTWTDRLEIIERLRTKQGEMTSMKVSLSGRPGLVEKRAEVVVTTMSFTAQLSNQPHGMPIPPESPTLYTIYMTPKQWARVERSIENIEDKLLIDGVCAFDPATNGMAVFATAVTSELLIEQQRSSNKPVIPTPKSKPPKAAVDPSSTIDTQAKNAQKGRRQPASPASSPSSPAGTPGATSGTPTKLSELRASASFFRQKIANLQAKPPGQQFGLEMTQKLLKNVEDEIATLEKKQNS